MMTTVMTLPTRDMANNTDTTTKRPDEKCNDGWVVLREVALLWFVVGIAGKFEEEESCQCDTM